MAETERALRWIVTGRVQDVSYRYFTRREAQTLGLVGWVKNLPDGSVEARVQGDPGRIEQLRERLLEGPGYARVEGIVEQELDLEEAGRDFRPGLFEIRF